MPHRAAAAAFLFLAAGRLLGHSAILQSEGPAPAEACLACHNSIKTALAKAVVHPAMESGCTTCHSDHRNRKPGETAPLRNLLEQPPQLCLQCHDAGEPALAAAHGHQPFANAPCTTCHNPHASDVPKLIPARAHGPYGARQCQACHQAAEGEKIRTRAVNALCFTCHEEVREAIAKSRHKHTVIPTNPNSCIDCHNPHATDLEFALKKSARDLCVTCHAEVIAGMKYVHEPVQVSCTLCHNPHSSDFPKNLHTSGNDLCLECHSRKSQEITWGRGPVALFEGRVQLPARSFDSIRRLELGPDGKRGHPLINHPVSAPKQGQTSEVTCLSCHRPHAANNTRSLLVTESADTTQLCLRCHNK